MRSAEAHRHPETLRRTEAHSGTLLAGRSRVVAVASGAALATASALTRMGIVEAGIESAKDPRYTVRVQRDRLERRRAAGVVHDSSVTVR